MYLKFIGLLKIDFRQIRVLVYRGEYYFEYQKKKKKMHNKKIIFLKITLSTVGTFRSLSPLFPRTSPVCNIIRFLVKSLPARTELPTTTTMARAASSATRWRP